MGTQAGAARRHGRRAVRLGDLAAAPLRRPGEPVADHRLRAPRPHRRAGRAVQAEGRRRCSRSSRASTPPTPPTTASRAASSATGRCAGCEQNGVARARRDGDEGRPGARRHAAAGVPRRRRARACRAARACACALGGIDLLTLDVHAQRGRAPRRRAPPAPTPRRRRRRRGRRRGRRRRSRIGDRRRRRRRRRPTPTPADADAGAPDDRRCADLSHAADRAAASRSARTRALLAVRFVDPRALQPRVQGHAARGDPGQRALQRAPEQGAGDRAGQPGRRRRGRQAAAPPRRCRRRRSTEVGDAPRRRAAQVEQHAGAAAAAAGADAARARAAAAARPAARPGHAAKSARRKSGAASCWSCWPRSRSASTRRTRGPKKRYISPATREEVYAVYYDALRRRIEERGTRNFPEHQGRKLYGELTMNVTVDPTAAWSTPRSCAPRVDACSTGARIAIVRAAGAVRPLQRTRCARQADQIVVTSRFRFTRDEGAGDQPLERATTTSRPHHGPLRRARQPGRAQPLAVHPRALRRADRRAHATTAACCARSTASRRRCAAFAPTGRRRAAATSRCPSSSRPLALAARAQRARRAGAAPCNVLRFDADGWHGDNTDGVGLVRDIAAQRRRRARAARACC